MQVGGEERIGELLARFEELQRFDHRFAAFDPAMVRRVGAMPTEYVYYFYDGRRYVDEVARAGASRGQDVLRLNTELLAAVAKAFDDGVDAAWSAYEMLLGVRRDTYMRTDTEGDSGQGEARARRAERGPARLAAAQIGGYEGLALQVIDGLSGGGQRRGDRQHPQRCQPGLPGPRRHRGGAGAGHRRRRAPLPVPGLPRAGRALVEQVKEYERGVVEAAMTGDAGLAGVALAQHPLVPGITAARELIAEYREAHGEYLDYLR